MWQDLSFRFSVEIIKYLHKHLRRNVQFNSLTAASRLKSNHYFSSLVFVHFIWQCIIIYVCYFPWVQIGVVESVYIDACYLYLEIVDCVYSYHLFRAQRWHVQFLVIWTFWCQVTSINQAFPVHKNFHLFSAVLLQNRQTYFGDMSSFGQELAAQRWRVGYVTFVLCKFLDLQSTEDVTWWT